MAEESPFFKFNVGEWLTGDIVFEPFDVQGVFINICALYWKKRGVLSLADIHQRYKKKKLIDRLVEGQFLSVENDSVSIKFLDEQIEARNNLSKVNSENGSKGGRPRKGEKRSATPEDPSSIAEAPVVFLELECEKFKEQYGEQMIKDFLRYWTETNKKGREKWQMEKTWETGKRLATWYNNSLKFNKNKIEPVVKSNVLPGTIGKRYGQ